MIFLISNPKKLKKTLDCHHKLLCRIEWVWISMRMYFRIFLTIEKKLVGRGYCQLARIITLVVDYFNFSDYTYCTLWV